MLTLELGERLKIDNLPKINTDDIDHKINLLTDKLKINNDYNNQDFYKEVISKKKELYTQ